MARSYVNMLNFQFGPQAADTRPDDLLPRDRVGHGTMSAMIAAGGRARGPSAEIVGVAPAAWVGNYKVFGSPGVNDGTYADVIIKALEDALGDGMDIATLNLGYAAEWPPLVRGCTDQPGGICDIMADAVHNATLRGLTVVAAAGNDGDLGFNLPTLGTIASPATAPGAYFVQVGAYSDPANAQRVRDAVSAAGPVVVDTRTTASGGELFRVRVGPWTSREEADSARRTLSTLGYAESVVASR